MGSRKGKEKVVEEAPRRRPTTRSASQKLMVDALKASARLLQLEVQEPSRYQILEYLKKNWLSYQEKKRREK